MVVIGVDLFAAVVGIIGFFSHLMRKGLELFDMTRDALKMALGNSNIRLNLQRLQDLAAAYRDRTLSQLGKDAIDDCVTSCRDTYSLIEDKLLKIQGSTTKFSRGFRAMWQSNALKELMSKMELSNTKLRDVLIMSQLQAGLDNAVRKKVQQTEKTFALAESRSGNSSYQNLRTPIRQRWESKALHYEPPYTPKVNRIYDLSSDDEASDAEAVTAWSEPLVQCKGYQGPTYALQTTGIEANFNEYFPTTTVTQVYDAADEDSVDDCNYKAIELREVIATQPQARLRSMKVTQKRTVEETPTSRKTSVEESIEFRFAKSCCENCVVM